MNFHISPLNFPTEISLYFPFQSSLDFPVSSTSFLVSPLTFLSQISLYLPLNFHVSPTDLPFLIISFVFLPDSPEHPTSLSVSCLVLPSRVSTNLSEISMYSPEFPSPDPPVTPPGYPKSPQFSVYCPPQTPCTFPVPFIHKIENCPHDHTLTIFLTVFFFATSNAILLFLFLYSSVKAIGIETIHFCDPN